MSNFRVLMKSTISIKIKAAFLLVVFALNTVVGFACSLGVDMGFNSPQHDKGSKGSVHIHKDGKVHVHKSAPDKPAGSLHTHKDGKAHEHKAAPAKGHPTADQSSSKKDDCCKGKVVKLQTADKNLQYTKATVSVPVFILPKAYTKTVLLKIIRPDLQPYIACHFHPPPRDIRIDIQSFQI
jgi:hypothetical protein